MCISSHDVSSYRLTVTLGNNLRCESTCRPNINLRGKAAQFRRQRSGLEWCLLRFNRFQRHVLPDTSAVFAASNVLSAVISTEFIDDTHSLLAQP